MLMPLTVQLCRVALIACVSCFLAAAGCKASSGEGGEKAGAAGALASEPVQFRFQLPADYVPLSLRGEGSETLRAPASATSSPIEGGFRIEASSEFVFEVRFQSPPLAILAAPFAAPTRVFEDKETLVFQNGTGFGFLVMRELVPEWDESERQRIACTSPGVRLDGASPPAEAASLSRSAIEAMVAACKSLELPKLE
jgi:hypothetical protein